VAITIFSGLEGRTSTASGLYGDVRARWMPYRLFPYEKRLGLRELETLSGGDIFEEDGQVAASGDADLIARRATYFEAVRNGAGTWLPTEQALVEAAHRDIRNISPTRQATRYGLHGIHEYKGKFNPQVVRALCNVVDLGADTLVDPFCGCGTALIEGLRLGLNVLGIDQSPIAAFVAEVKLKATQDHDRVRLAEDLLVLGERCAEVVDHAQTRTAALDVGEFLPPSARAYLERWFTPQGFAALTAAVAALFPERGSLAGQLALTALSSILREVSLQLPDDLRIRRRADDYVAPPIAPLFLESIHGIRRGLLEIGDWPPLQTQSQVRQGTAEDHSAYDMSWSARRRLILTSPPYATALPYIDTDRLSLVALGLTPADDLLPLERGLIGSREWTRKEQLVWDRRRLENRDGLPLAVTSLAYEIAERNSGTEAGFRRRAVASLLYRYFARMGTAIAQWHRVLLPGEFAVLIVGHNHTKAGGERVDIPTPELLGRVAEARGFTVKEIIRLETWPRYGLHAANGVPGEDALIIRRCG
jgi:hypothetical protein